jgi:hypothetical protein
VNHWWPAFAIVLRSIHKWRKPCTCGLKQEERDLVITDNLLINQAIIFGAQCDVPKSFTFSLGWLQGFKKRWGIRSLALHGEAGDANLEGVALARASLPGLLEARGYSKEDCYNQDETGLLWRQMPTRTHASARKAGKKTEMERVTVSLTRHVPRGAGLPPFFFHTPSCQQPGECLQEPEAAATDILPDDALDP